MSYARPKLYGFSDVDAKSTHSVISDRRRLVAHEPFAVVADVRGTPTVVKKLSTETSGDHITLIDKKDDHSTTIDPKASLLPAPAVSMPPVAVADNKATSDVAPVARTDVGGSKVVALAELINILERNAVKYQLTDLNPALAMARDSIDTKGMTHDEVSLMSADKAAKAIRQKSEGFTDCKCSRGSGDSCSVNLFDSRYMSSYDKREPEADRALRVEACKKVGSIPLNVPRAKLDRSLGLVVGNSTYGYGVEY